MKSTAACNPQNPHGNSTDRLGSYRHVKEVMKKVTKYLNIKTNVKLAMLIPNKCTIKLKLLINKNIYLNSGNHGQRGATGEKNTPGTRLRHFTRRQYNR